MAKPKKIKKQKIYSKKLHQNACQVFYSQLNTLKMHISTSIWSLQQDKCNFILKNVTKSVKKRINIQGAFVVLGAIVGNHCPYLYGKRPTLNLYKIDPSCAF